MRYDRLGFPIPPEFEPPAGGDDPFPRRAGPRRPWPPGLAKRLVIVAVLAGVMVPAVIAPAVMPIVREGVVQWSLDRAMRREGRGAVAEAIVDLGRALRWGGDLIAADPRRKSRLLCWRAMLEIEHRDLAAALADAELAASVAPTDVQPVRVRALVHVIREEHDAALAAAELAVELAGGEDPEARNHRAYVRALVGRELEAALEDVEVALQGSGAGSPEYLDTRGFILHLLGRQQEALDDLNLAIEGAQAERRRLLMLSGHVDPGDLACRLRSADHGLAVMHHHRGLACRALGLRRQADQDFAVAEKKGYDPARGIF